MSNDLCDPCLLIKLLKTDSVDGALDIISGIIITLENLVNKKSTNDKNTL